MVAEIADTSFWARNGASAHLEAQLGACLSNTFATFEGVAGRTRMARGTGAGNPLADLMFLLAFMKVIQRLRKALTDAGLVVTFDVNGARSFLGLFPGDAAEPDIDRVALRDVSFADDLAFIIAALAKDMAAALVKAGEIIWRVYEECGFRVNFGVAKTAAMVKWCGPDGKLRGQLLSSNTTTPSRSSEGIVLRPSQSCWCINTSARSALQMWAWDMKW